MKPAPRVGEAEGVRRVRVVLRSDVQSASRLQSALRSPRGAAERAVPGARWSVA